MKIVPDNYRIQPKHIDTSDHFWNAFDNMETEVSAHYIVKLCQRRKGWLPFTQKEIEEEYRRAGHTDGFTFNLLVSGDWIIQCGDQYLITEEFVNACYKSSPKNGKIN